MSSLREVYDYFAAGHFPGNFEEASRYLSNLLQRHMKSSMQMLD